MDKPSFERPHDIDEATLTFPVYVAETLIPKREELPEEFQKNWCTNCWCQYATCLFFVGGRLGPFKPGIDAEKASLHIRVVLSSFNLKHEHKIGAAGWLLSMWMDECPKR